jgi:opacity protein-like surface antigen
MYSFPMTRKLALCLLLSISSAYAENSAHPHLQLSLAGGIDWYHSSNTNIIISPFETDSLHVNHTSTNGAWKIGLGYYLFDDQLSCQNYFNHLLLELNLYQTNTKLKGSVWQYELAEFNNYNFKAPITSTRLMLDVKPTIFNWRNLSLYFILGVGRTWNEISYQETVSDESIDPASSFSLSEATTNQFAWDAGVGFKFEFNPQWSATAEYLYTRLGNAAPSTNSSSAAMTSAPKFSLSVQNLLIGLSYKL